MVGKDLTTLIGAAITRSEGDAVVWTGNNSQTFMAPGTGGGIFVRAQCIITPSVGNAAGIRIEREITPGGGWHSDASHFQAPAAAGSFVVTLFGYVAPSCAYRFVRDISGSATASVVDFDTVSM